MVKTANNGNFLTRTKIFSCKLKQFVFIEYSFLNVVEDLAQGGGRNEKFLDCLTHRQKFENKVELELTDFSL